MALGYLLNGLETIAHIHSHDFIAPVKIRKTRGSILEHIDKDESAQVVDGESESIAHIGAGATPGVILGLGGQVGEARIPAIHRQGRCQCIEVGLGGSVIIRVDVCHLVVPEIPGVKGQARIPCSDQLHKILFSLLTAGLYNRFLLTQATHRLGLLQQIAEALGGVGHCLSRHHQRDQK